MRARFLLAAGIGAILAAGAAAILVDDTDDIVSLPPPPDMPSGMVMAPLEITGAARTEGRAAIDADMAAVMAWKTNSAALGWNFTATQDGWFDDPATWGGAGTPQAGQRALIPMGRKVWVRANVPALKLLWCEGFFGVHPDANVLIEIDTFVGDHMSQLWIGDASTPFNGRCEWRFPQSNLDLAFDPRMQSKVVMTMGHARLYGKAKDAFLATDGTAVVSGATSLTLAAPPLGWEVGDEIVIPPVRMIKPATWGNSPPEPGNEAERRVITAINGATVSWADPLVFDHTQPAYSPTTMLHIVNNNRNIVFASPPGAPVHQRGHLMFMHTASVDVKYIECGWLGRTDKRAEARDFDNHPNQPANGGTGMTPASNVKGRYAGPHFHVCGPDAMNIKCHGCAVHDGLTLGFVNHRSNVDFTMNSATFMWGAGMFTESGNEAGLLDGYCGIAHFTNRQDTSNKFHEDEARHDWGHAQMVWMQSRVPLVRNVFLYGGSNATGFVFNIRGAKSAKVRPKTLERRNIREITHRAEYFFSTDGENFQVHQLFPHGPSIDAAGIHVQACLQSVHVEKAGSKQDHYDYSIIRDVTIVNCARGLHTEYTGRYLLDNIITRQQPDCAGFVGSFDNGIRIAIEAFQFTTRNYDTEGYDYGIHYDHVAVDPNGAEDREIVPDDKWHNFIVTPVTGNARTELIHPSFAATAKDELVDEGDLDLNPAYPLFTPSAIEIPATEAAFNAATPILAGTVTDSLGTRALPAGRDRYYRMTKGDIWGHLRTKGFWVEQGTGRCFFEWTEVLRDAATGVRKDHVRRIYLAQGAFSNDPRGNPPGVSPWITGGWVNNGTKA